MKRKTVNIYDDDESEDIILDNSLYYNLNKRILYLHGDITTKVGLIFAKTFDILNKSDKSILININSSGGAYDAAVSIINSIQNSPATIHTYISGSAYSAAGFIFLAGKKRIMTPPSSLMFHYPIYKQEDFLDRQKENIVINEDIFDKLIEYLLEDTKVKRDVFFNKIKNTDGWYISPEEAKEFGFSNEKKINR